MRCDSLIFPRYGGVNALGYGRGEPMPTGTFLDALCELDGDEFIVLQGLDERPSSANSCFIQ